MSMHNNGFLFCFLDSFGVFVCVCCVDCTTESTDEKNSNKEGGGECRQVAANLWCPGMVFDARD